MFCSVSLAVCLIQTLLYFVVQNLFFNIQNKLFLEEMREITGDWRNSQNRDFPYFGQL